jgi:hypothetical protein
MCKNATDAGFLDRTRPSDAPLAVKSKIAGDLTVPACPPQTFANFSQDRFDRLVQAAAGNGIVLNGPEGQTTYIGITVRWKFDAAAQSMEIQCIDNAMMLPCGLIDAKLHEMVTRCP